jgi:hypothetical protein
MRSAQYKTHLSLNEQERLQHGIYYGKVCSMFKEWGESMIRWGVGVVEACDDEALIGQLAEAVTTAPQEVIIRQEHPNREQLRALHWAHESGMRPLKQGDRVLLNRTSLDLQLGSGGFALVAAILESDAMNEDSLGVAPTGHMIKLRYTPYQRAVLAAEEENSPYHAWFTGAGQPGSPHLEGMPVLIGELHSMLPIAMCWLRGDSHSTSAPRTAYIMTDGGSLPISLSRHVHTLQGLGWLAGTVTYGHAYGGDLETINKFTALLAARHMLEADLAIVTMGPGIAGTGTPLGHTAMEIGELVNAVIKLGGRPFVIPRISFADSRERHFGISHHTLTALRWAAWGRTAIPLPANLAPHERETVRSQIEQAELQKHHDMEWIEDLHDDEIAERLARYPETIRTMGRDFVQDPLFFRAVAASAELALRCLKAGYEDL